MRKEIHKSCLCQERGFLDCRPFTILQVNNQDCAFSGDENDYSIVIGDESMAQLA